MQTHFLGAFIVFFSSCPRGVGVDKRQFSKVIYSDAWRKLILTFFSFFLPLFADFEVVQALASPLGSPSQQLELQLELHLSSGPWAVFSTPQSVRNSSNTKWTAATWGRRLLTTYIYIYIWFFHWISQLQLATFLGSEFMLGWPGL